MASPRRPVAPSPGLVHARRSAMLLLAGLIAAGAPLPYSALAVVPLGWAGFESVLALRARSADPSPNRSVVSSVVSLVLVGILTLIVLLPYAVYGTAKRLQDCTSGANTAIARAECDTQFSSRFDSFLGGLLSSGG